MKWDIAENCRADIVGYSGVNYSGDRFETRIFPSGRQGDELPGARIKSMAILAPVGTRVILRTSLQNDWQEHTWRVVRIMDGKTFSANDGRIGVRIPDLDSLAPPDAYRLNPDIVESYPLTGDPDAKLDWTYGKVGKSELKNGIVMIMVDKNG